MPPVRVKVYGLIPISKRVFLVLQGLSFSFLLCLFATALWLQPDGDAVRAVAEPEVDMLDGTEPPGPWGAGALKILAFMIDNAPWVLIGLIALGLVETFAIWRRFRQAEREAAVMGPLLERLDQHEAHENGLASRVPVAESKNLSPSPESSANGLVESVATADAPSENASAVDSPPADEVARSDA